MTQRGDAASCPVSGILTKVFYLWIFASCFLMWGGLKSRSSYFFIFVTSLSYLPVSLRLEGFVCSIYVSCLKKFSYLGPIKYSPMIFSKRVIISTFSFMRLRNMKLIFLLVVLEKDLIFFLKKLHSSSLQWRLLVICTWDFYSVSLHNYFNYYNIIVWCYIW